MVGVNLGSPIMTKKDSVALPKLLWAGLLVECYKSNTRATRVSCCVDLLRRFIVFDDVLRPRIAAWTGSIDNS